MCKRYSSNPIRLVVCLVTGALCGGLSVSVQAAPAKEIDVQEPIVGVVFGDAGLPYNLTSEGTEINVLQR